MYPEPTRIPFEGEQNDPMFGARVIERLDRLEAKVDALLALLDRYRPLLDKAEARFARPPMFGARKNG